MRGSRLLHSIGLLLTRGGYQRANYLRKHHVFANIGYGTYYKRRVLPLYPELISIGNNCSIADVSFTTHDIIHLMLNRMGGDKYDERIGCIEIGDNVFVGAGTKILYDVRIGSNVIIGAGSLVTKDIPDNVVAAGSPARVIGSFEDYLKKRNAEEKYPEGLAPKREQIPKELADWCWKRFYEKRTST